MHPRPDDQLSSDELQRYHRHLILPHVGEAGQRRLKAARVMLVGVGGLGSPVALYLAAAGVGHIGMVDPDVVESSNLQRQIIHDTRGVGRPKVDSARDAINALNPFVHAATYHARLTSQNALDILGGYDIVVDGSDNFETRYLVNDACVLLGKPNIHGSVLRFDGQATVLGAPGGPCYRCLFPEPPAPGTIPDCAEGGVLGVLPGLIGMIQATETIKLITGAGETLVGRLLLVDALRMRFQSIDVAKDPACPMCGTRTITELQNYAAFCGSADAQSSAPTSPGEFDDSHSEDVTPQWLAARLREGTALTLIDVREPYEWTIAHLPTARLVPLNTLPKAVGTIDRAADIVLYCHHGSRSDAAATWLRDQGFRSVRNLTGGIDRWSLEIDASVRRY